MSQSLSRSPGFTPSASAGFTLLEALIVMVIIGLMAAIATPNFIGFLNQRKINATQDMVYQAIRATQAEAMQKRQGQQFSLRQRQGQVEWASHSSAIDPKRVALWNSLVEGVILANIDNTLTRRAGVYYVQFDMHGNLKSKSIGQQGTLTFTVTNQRATNRCVVVSTILGALRKGRGHAKARNKRFCY